MIQHNYTKFISTHVYPRNTIALYTISTSHILPSHNRRADPHVHHITPPPLPICFPEYAEPRTNRCSGG